MKNPDKDKPERHVIVVLENASLETVKLGAKNDSRYTLLNCDDHQNILRKNNRAATDLRPDITHQCLLMLLDSPLNKAGLLQVFVHTAKNVLIEISPHTRLPRTFRRFSGLMKTSEKLLKVIKNPIEDHLPTKCYKIALSGDSGLVNLSEYVKGLPQDSSIALFIGAHAHGEDNWADQIIDQKISISEYPLSAAIVCAKMVSFELFPTYK